MSTPPTTPPGPPTRLPPKPGESGFENYQRIAETVGMMPSLRKKDNIVQGVICGVGATIGAALGYFLGKDFEYGPPVAAILGGLAGFAVLGLLSGIVLMVLGWVRLGKNR